MNIMRQTGEGLTVLMAAVALCAVLVLMVAHPTLNSSVYGQEKRPVARMEAMARDIAANVTLNPSAHPPGTRFLEPCGISDDPCERVVLEWSPSGKYVKVARVGSFDSVIWRLPSKIKVVELLVNEPRLAVPTAKAGEWRLQ